MTKNKSSANFGSKKPHPSLTIGHIDTHDKLKNKKSDKDRSGSNSRSTSKNPHKTFQKSNNYTSNAY
jgi:hypothetical protein